MAAEGATTISATATAITAAASPIASRTVWRRIFTTSVQMGSRLTVYRQVDMASGFCYLDIKVPFRADFGFIGFG